MTRSGPHLTKTKGKGESQRLADDGHQRRRRRRILALAGPKWVTAAAAAAKRTAALLAGIDSGPGMNEECRSLWSPAHPNNTQDTGTA